MANALNTLLLEDQHDDARLLVRALERAGFDPTWERVDTEEDFVARLRPELDVILADYELPQFDATRAIRLVQERDQDVPVIVVTGSISEETAVECIKRGAADYLLKDRLARLGPAVLQALDQRRQRRERRLADDALRASEARFHAAFTVSPFPSAIIDLATGDLLDVNDEFVSSFGYARTDVLGRSGSEIGMWRALDEGARIAQALRLSANLRNFETRLVTASGEIRSVVLSAESLEVGGRHCVFASWYDVTNRKQLEAQLLQAQRLESVGRLAGGVAHDFNNLLTVIQGYSEFTLLALGAEDEARHFVDEIKDAAGRAASLTRQLLAFSRRQVLQPTNFNINRTIAEIGRMLERLIGDDVQLEVREDPDLGTVCADKGQIEQVIVNLVVNARDAMPEGGQVLIESSNVSIDESYSELHVGASPGAYVMLAVSDTGCGMDEKTKAHIFEPFFTTKEPGRGTGLGLATVHGIVKQSGGWIEVYSEIDRGTVFKVYLPRVDADAEDAARGLDEAKADRGTETILVVEDQEKVRELAVHILRRRGYSVLEAGNAQEALAACEAHRNKIDLLLSDLVLPGTSGRELATKLAEGCRDLRVLFMSGYTEDGVLRQGILDVGLNFLQKPFTPEKLAKRVRDVLDAEPGKP